MANAIRARTLSTRRFVLRPFKRKDAALIDDAVAGSLPELRKWLPWAVGYKSSSSQQYVRDSMTAWSDGRAYDFSIRRPEAPDRHIGNVSVWYVSKINDVGEIGYWIRTDETGDGIGTEATARILEFAFNDLHMHRVTLRIAVGNKASERLAEKLGFLFEGTLREEVRVGSDWLDHTVWGLLRTEWAVERQRYEANRWV